jgi:hypothetical protein
MNEMVPVKKKKRALSLKKQIELERFLELYIDTNYNGTKAYCLLKGVVYDELDEKQKPVKRQQAVRMFTGVHFREMLAARQEHLAEKYKLQREAVIDEVYNIAKTSRDEQNKIRAASVHLAATQGAAIMRQATGASAVLNPDGSLEVKLVVENTSGAIDEFNKATGYQDAMNDENEEEYIQ